MHIHTWYQPQSILVASVIFTCVQHIWTQTWLSSVKTLRQFLRCHCDGGCCLARTEGPLYTFESPRMLRQQPNNIWHPKARHQLFRGLFLEMYLFAISFKWCIDTFFTISILCANKVEMGKQKKWRVMINWKRKIPAHCSPPHSTHAPIVHWHLMDHF